MNNLDWNELQPFEVNLLNSLQQLNVTKDLCVAFSGGLDSKSLLHALVRLRSFNLIKNLQAIHVNHGLQVIADQWLSQCELDCVNYQVTLITTKLNFDEPSSLTNVEAIARQGRYDFFESVIVENQTLVMGHHLDDQAETLLFRLLRGCGLDGAAGMPKIRPLGKGCLIRPLLDISRSEIEEYAKYNNLSWIEDPTNQKDDYSRNFLRHKILPKLKQKWPSYHKTLSRFTKVASEQNLLLAEIAQDDYSSVKQNVNQLDVNLLTHLSLARQKNLLHYWGKSQAQLAPSFNEINQVIHQLEAAKSQSINVRFSTGRVRSFNHYLILSLKSEPEPLLQTIIWGNILNPIELPYGVSIHTQKISNLGVRLPNQNEKVVIKFREGGERCLPDYRDKTTDLKKIYQELNIPPWRRVWLPIIYYNQNIVAVPGVFVDKNFLNKTGETAINLSFELRVQG